MSIPVSSVPDTVSSDTEEPAGHCKCRTARAAGSVSVVWPIPDPMIWIGLDADVTLNPVPDVSGG